jgi:nitrate reductase NapAB chaperone NapD
MPIKSYLVHPVDGKKEALLEALSTLEECDITPAENENVLVLVTETKDDTHESLLKQKLEAISSIKLLSLVSGFNTSVNR